ncbi:MAG: NUDIX hydrolase [Deltaproteobacteria bacterium]|nr:NUDIX hydrolase [Deltaproteobacteria bacterium]
MKRDIQRQAVVAIIRKSDRFLFVKRSDYVETGKGYWCPISGTLEYNETQEQALKREVMEEVGLEIDPIQKICEIPSHDNQSLLHFWTTRIISGEAQITSNEVVDMKWVTLEEMKQLMPVFKDDIRVFEGLSDM